MKRFTLLILLIVAFGLIFAGPAMARDLGEIGETAFDTLIGDNSGCPMLVSGYIAKTWEMEDGPDIRAKIKYTSSIRDLTGRNSVEASIGLEF